MTVLSNIISFFKEELESKEKQKEVLDSMTKMTIGETERLREKLNIEINYINYVLNKLK